MKTLALALLVAYFAVNADTKAQNAALEQQGGRSSATAAEPPPGPSNPPNDNFAGESNTTQEASYDVFYDRLQSDGRWFNDETSGSRTSPLRTRTGDLIPINSELEIRSHPSSSSSFSENLVPGFNRVETNSSQY
jgi:hypothetical protein